MPLVAAIDAKQTLNTSSHMPAVPHKDKLAYRLAQLLRRLNEGDKLHPQTLADEFEVDRQTIMRDLTQRFDFLDLQKTNDGWYEMAPERLGRITLNNVERFVSLAGINGLYPGLNQAFLRELLTGAPPTTLLVQPQAFESIDDPHHWFAALKAAIQDRRVVHISYQKDSKQGTEVKRYQGLEPYKMVHNQGVWYLVAGHDGNLKAFTFSKILSLDVTHACFVPEARHEQMLEQEDSIWLNANKKEVVLKVAKAVAHYFERRKLVGGQKIDKQLEDGSLLVSCRVAHPTQIVPTVRYWMPHVRIFSPEGWQKELEEEMRAYLGEH